MKKQTSKFQESKIIINITLKFEKKKTILLKLRTLIKKQREYMLTNSRNM